MGFQVEDKWNWELLCRLNGDFILSSPQRENKHWGIYKALALQDVQRNQKAMGEGLEEGIYFLIAKEILHI